MRTSGTLARGIILLALVAHSTTLVRGQSNTITVNPNVTLQTMRGWEVVAYADRLNPNFPLYRDSALNNAVDAGINRIRLEVRSGSENPVDAFAQWQAAGYPTSGSAYTTWRAKRYETINDNNDPFVINPAGFNWTDLDGTIDDVVTPLRQKLAARGETLYVHFDYVAFLSQVTSGAPYVHQDPNEYAEFMVAAFQHLQSKYGWTPQGLALMLEPDNVSPPWSGTLMGQVIAATGPRLAALGFTPDFIGPSTVCMSNAAPWFDDLIAVPNARLYIKEISYHRYCGVDTTALQSIASRGAANGIGTSMLEWWSDANTFNVLHEDLTVGRNSAWEQVGIADAGGPGSQQISYINASNQAVFTDRTKFFRQYYQHVRLGAVRVGASTQNSGFDPVAFRNTNGTYTVVVKAAGGGPFTVAGLPAGTYGINYTASTSYAADMPNLEGSAPDQTIAAGQALTANIPSYGVITIFGKTVAAPNQPPTISDVTSQTIAQNGSTGSLPFTVGDAETPAGNLVVTATSSNTTLVPVSSVVLGGSGAARTATVTPVAGRSGTATITLTVSDGSATASDSFVLTVTPPPNTAPFITDVPDQSVVVNVATAVLPFTVSDAETAAGSLVVTAASSNTTLVPVSAVVLGGSGGSRTVRVTPVAGRTGVATVTLTVSDGSLTASDAFSVTVVAAANTAPTISDVPNQTIQVNTSTSTVPFTVGDAETAAGSLVVTATSSNTTLVPVSAVVVGGSGASRTVRVTPVASRTGVATVTLTVSDGSLTASDTFVVTVTAAANSAPTIGDVSNQTIQVNTSTDTMPFTVGDAETAAGSLVVTAASSNTTLVPVSAVVLGGSGASRTVRVTPVAGRTGTATVTLTVSDGSLTASDTFVVTVNAAANTAPTISDVPNQTLQVNTSTSALPFTVGDAETSAGSLVVTATSSNTTLLPVSRVVLGGTGATRTVTVSPAEGQSGSATLTLTVSDGALTSSDTFLVTVTAAAGNRAPTISDVPNQTIQTNTSSSIVPFIVGDAETVAGNLLVTATSSNSTLVSGDRVVLGGSGAARTVQVMPAANQTGSATITLTVSDGVLTASDSFVVTVTGDPLAIQPPTELAVIGMKGTAVTLRWTPPSSGPAPTGYMLEGGQSPGQVLGSVRVNASTTIYSLRLPRGWFYFRAYALKGASKSVASNETSIGVAVPALPSQPKNLIGLAVGNALNLSWTPTLTGGEPTAMMLDVSGAVNTSVPLQPTDTFDFASMPPGTYTFRVRASNDSGASAASNPVTLTFPAACSGPPLATPDFVASVNGNTVDLSWDPPAGGAAPTGYVLNVAGAVAISVPTRERRLSWVVPPGTYNLSVVSTNPCGASAPTAVQAITVP